ncbi:glycoside hydrolase family 18 protein [Adhaeribacter radiodurans]|uniref:chitinase n=1 Tax=Adhaeribacter radiodurans TaxID=2745197 RepID=A0A7L7LE54_9BACT|nr:glycoside hydrolase family 18 protein [Adhaeribacter radiodurans]QMU31053.1 glycoside hydrolase family 18 protein [Adhaeribacter radiodurans]
MLKLTTLFKKQVYTCLLFSLLLIFSISAQGQAQTAPVTTKPVIIGYVGGFRGLVNTETISANKLTHINYAFVNVKGNRAFLTNLATDTTNFRKLNLLKKQNPELKILISLGGWVWSENFSDAVLSDTSRQAFAASCVRIMQENQLDGVDIDWEYPAIKGEEDNIYRPEDTQNFTLMFAALRQELDKLQAQTGKKYLLTTAIPTFMDFINHTEMGKAQQYLDYVNLMTYDYSGGPVAGHHSNLYASKKYDTKDFAAKAVKDYSALGVPTSKMVIGLAFYGKGYDLAEAKGKGIGQKVIKPSEGGGYTKLKDTLINKNGYKAYRDKKAKAPYLYNAAEKKFITYEDEWSIRNKCKFVLDNKLAGVMFWEYNSDPKEYLLTEVNRHLK